VRELKYLQSQAELQPVWLAYLLVSTSDMLSRNHRLTPQSPREKRKGALQMERDAEAKKKLGGFLPHTSGPGLILPGDRPLFSYKRYADQEPLAMTPGETAAVVALVLGPEAVAGLLGAEYSSLLNVDCSVAHSGLLPGGNILEVCMIESSAALPRFEAYHRSLVGMLEGRVPPSACSTVELH
jgi:hypothetical protein